jgi:NTE family protein
MAFRGVTGHVRAPPKAVAALVNETAPLRELARSAEGVQQALSRPDVTPAARDSLTAQLQSLDRDLFTRYGYHVDTLPRPGSLFVDPYFYRDELSGGRQLQGRSFPRGAAPVVRPPSPQSALLGSSRPLELISSTGSPETLASMEQYKAFVARQRRSHGAQQTDGEPIGVHLVMKGAAMGRTKRYPALVDGMLRMGVVPVKVSGTSSGALVAAMIAAGAGPLDLRRVVMSSPGRKLIDIGLGQHRGGLATGAAVTEYLEKWLSDLTGVRGRPVLFSDLEMPLEILAAKMSDSAPPAGRADLSVPENRIFIFSQATTANTPVALAVRASISGPVLFNPVQLVDPLSGRHVQLEDGGMLDNFPIGRADAELPVVGLLATSRNANHPGLAAHNARPMPLPGGNLNVGGVASNLFQYLRIKRNSAEEAAVFEERTNPERGVVYADPLWLLADPSRGNHAFQLKEAPVDRELDVQSREGVMNYLTKLLPSLASPRVRATNLTGELPTQLSFQREFSAGGVKWVARYDGGDHVLFEGPGGKKKRVRVSRRKVESMWLDDQAFGDMAVRLEHLGTPRIKRFITRLRQVVEDPLQTK